VTAARCLPALGVAELRAELIVARRPAVLKERP
jgi:hypothetical protein